MDEISNYGALSITDDACVVYVKLINEECAQCEVKRHRIHREKTSYIITNFTY